MTSKVQPLGLEANASLGFKDRLKIPFASPADYPELGGVADGVTDSTAAWQAAADTGLTVWGPPGRWYVTDQVVLQNKQVLQGAGRTSCVFVMDGSFNLSASGVVRLGTGEPGAQIYDVGFEFGQPSFEGMTRANLIQYPPAIDAKNIPRHVIDRVRITLGWDGIDATENTGGCYHGFIESGCFNKSLTYDGGLDFVSLDRLHHWPFGASNPASPLGALMVDGQAIALECGLVESAAFGVVQSFKGRVVITAAASATSTTQSIGLLAMDGDGADLSVAGGNWSIGGGYTSKSIAPTTNPITISDDAVVSFSNFYGAVSCQAHMVVVSDDARATFTGGRLLHVDKDFSAIKQLGGTVIVNSVDLALSEEIRTVGYIDSDAGVLIVNACSSTPTGAGSGPIIKADAGVTTVVSDNSFDDWSIDIPDYDALTNPTVTAAAGAGLVASASVRHTVSNGFMDVTGTVVVTTRGTATGSLSLDLAYDARYRVQFAAAEIATSGVVCRASLDANSNTLNLNRFDNDFVGPDGSIVVFSGRYRIV